MLLTEPTYLLSISHQMILSALAKTERIRDHSGIKTQCKPPISRKYSKTFRPAKAINSTNQQQRSAAATSSNDQQQQPAAAVSSSEQQQRPAATTSSSNQQQRSAAATGSSEQQQQPAAAISIHPTSSTYTINADLRYLSLRFLAVDVSLAIHLGLVSL